MQGDDEEDVHAEAAASEETGSEGEGAEGQELGGGDEESDLSAQRAADEGDEGPPPARTPAVDATQSRGSNRFRQLANDAKAAREEAERSRRELEEFKRQQWQRQQESEQRDHEQRRALMTPEERYEFDRARDRRELQQTIQQQNMQMAAQMDKASYDAAAATHPVYRRMAAEVEQKFQEQMAKGQPTDRRTILAWLVGMQALDGAANSAPRRAAARKRLDGQAVRPARPAGDQSTTRKVSTAEERLRDVLI